KIKSPKPRGTAIVQLAEKIFSKDKPFFILGPCVIESRDLLHTVAEKVKKVGERYDAPVIFKVSFDKANRTSISSYRGKGMDEGLRLLEEIKKEFDLPVTTDMHESYQAAVVGEVVDVLQIPAFLCRQTDLL